MSHNLEIHCLMPKVLLVFNAVYTIVKPKSCLHGSVRTLGTTKFRTSLKQRLSRLCFMIKKKFSKNYRQHENSSTIYI